MVNIKISHYIMGIIVFTFFIMAGTSMILEFRATDATFAVGDEFTDFNDTFNTYSDATSSIGSLETSITGADPDPGAFGTLNALISTGWNTLRTTISSFGFMNNVFLGSNKIFGVPAWIAGLARLVVTVIFVFSIFSAIFQRET